LKMVEDALRKLVGAYTSEVTESVLSDE